MFDVSDGEAFLFGDIGQHFVDGVGAAEVALGLQQFKGDFTLRLQSNGGDVFEGLAIYSAIARHPGKVTISVEGIAASIASVIAMAGSRVEMQPRSMLMIHNPFAGLIGGADDMRHMASLLDKIAEQVAGIYASKAGKPVKHMLALMEAETYLDAAEAVQLGLADAVAGAGQRRVAASRRNDNGVLPIRTQPKVAAAAFPNRERLRLKMRVNRLKHRGAGNF